MKLTTLFIALAMLAMILEGCDHRPGGGETYGQKIDRGLEKANQMIIPIGARMVSRDDQADTAKATEAGGG
ncbi:MAG: hypothetical protein KAX84_17060 [Burkholderiales bacterium]|nr:hypothetical protein [Burkholderiales bacterium]